MESAVWVVAVVLGVLQGAHARITVLSDGGDELWSFDASVGNKFIGPQTTDRVNVTAPVFVAEDWVVQDCSGVQGKVVAVLGDHDLLWDLAEVRRASSQLEACGALAVVKLGYPGFGAREQLGFFYHATQSDCCRDVDNSVRVPVLVAWHTDIDELGIAAEQGANLTLRIAGADPNPWVEDMTHSDVFFAFSRVLMPAIDICVGLVVLRALGLHAGAWIRNRGKARKGIMDGMRAYLVIASLMQFTGCAVRTVYCISGPFLCNARLLVDESMMLINLSLPLQLPSIFVVSAMMRRVTSVKRSFDPPSKRKVLFLVVVALGVWALELYAGYIRGRSNDEMPVVFSYACAVLVCLWAFVLFVSTGVPFLVQMRQSQAVQQDAKIAHSSTVHTIRVRIARSVVLGSVGLLLQTVSVGMFPAFPSAKGFAAVFTLYYLGFAITTLFHSLAFAPLFRVSVKQKGKPSAGKIFLVDFARNKTAKSRPNTDSVATQVGFVAPKDLQARPEERDIPTDSNKRNEADHSGGGHGDAGQGPEDEEGQDVEQEQQGGIQQGKGGERVGRAEKPLQQVEPADQPPLRPVEHNIRDNSVASAPVQPRGEDDEWQWDYFQDDVLVNDPNKERESSGAVQLVIVGVKQTPAIIRRKLDGVVRTGSINLRREVQQPRASPPQHQQAPKSPRKHPFSRFHSAQ